MNEKKLGIYIFIKNEEESLALQRFFFANKIPWGGFSYNFIDGVTRRGYDHILISDTFGGRAKFHYGKSRDGINEQRAQYSCHDFLRKYKHSRSSIISNNGKSLIERLRHEHC